jgi:hypothetical protein
VKNPVPVPTVVSSLETLTSTISTTEGPSGQGEILSVLAARAPAPIISVERQEKILADYVEMLGDLCRPKADGSPNDYAVKHGLSPEFQATLVSEAKEILKHVPTMRDTRDPWRRAMGRTVLWNGQPFQDRKSVKNQKFTCEEYVEFWNENSLPGEKGEGPAAYDCIFIRPGNPNKWNCLLGYSVTAEFDSKIIEGQVVSGIRHEDDRLAVLAYFEGHGWGHKEDSGSSHEPDKGLWSLKYQIPCEPISYNEKEQFGEIIHAEICARIEIRSKQDLRWKMVDPIINRSIQLQHLPRWKNESRVRQARKSVLTQGNAINFDWCREIVAARDAAKAAKLSREAAAKVAAAELREAQGLPPIDPSSIDGVPLDDRLRQARRLVTGQGGLGPAVTGQTGGTHTFKVIQACRRCGLDRKETHAFLMAEWDHLCSPPWGASDLWTKIEHCWDSGRGEAGSSLRRRLSSPSTFDAVSGITEFDLGDVGQGGTTDTEQTTSPCPVSRTFSLDREIAKDGTAVDGTPDIDVALSHTPSSVAKAGGVMDKWWGGVNNPSKVTKLHVGGLPVMVWAALHHKLTVIESPCGTQKSRAYFEMVRYLLRLGLRVVIVVPGQSLSQDLARQINEGLEAQFHIQSHMDVGVDWTGSLVVCINSVAKVRRFTAVEKSGVQEFGLGEKPKKEKVKDHPVSLLIIDEFGELNDCRVGALILKARMADAVHAAMRDLCINAEKIVACQAHSEVDDLSCLVFEWCNWGGKKAKPNADWHLIVNSFHHLKPDVYVGASKNRIRKERLKSWRKGVRSISSFSTVVDSQLESNLWAVNVMSEMAGFDVGPFCGPGYVLAREPAAKLPELVALLSEKGLTLDQVRPPSILINKVTRKNPEVKAFLANPNQEILKVAAVFHTASIKSGFSIYVPCAVFAQLQAGKGPDYKGLHQMVLRCRLPVDNCIHLSILGQCKPKSTDENWWHAHFTRLNADTEKFMGDGSGKNGPTYRLERRDDGEVYLTDLNDELVWALAKAQSRRQARIDISDKRDDMGNVVEWGVLCDFWRRSPEEGGCGFTVIPMYRSEEEASWTVPVEEQKAQDKIEKTRSSDTRINESRKVADARIISREEADRLRKDHLAGGEETHYEIESCDLRYRYGLEKLTTDDVEWDRKHGDELAVFAQMKAVRNHSDKVKEVRLEWDSPILVHHDHKPSKAARLNAIMDELGLSDLHAAATSGYEIPNLSLMLEQRGEDQEVLHEDFGISWQESDKEKNRYTIAFLRHCGIRTLETRKRANGRAHKRKVNPEWLAMMDQKSELMVLRMVDPDKAKEKWEEIESKALGTHIPIESPAETQRKYEEFLQAILDESPTMIVNT